jgi:hypothetical protein
MRSVPLVMVCATVASVSAAMAEPPDELMTAQNAILCVSPDNLDTAHQAAVAKSQLVLRAMGCIRAETGIRTRLLEGSDVQRPWRVRFYPIGISGGVELWGLPSSFTTPDRPKPLPATKSGAVALS